MTRGGVRAACLLAAIAFGFALWASAPAIVGTREPWDAPQPHYYSAAMLLGGGLLGLAFPRHAFSAYFGLWIGQFLVFLLLPGHDRSWALLAALTTGIGSLIGVLGFVAGALLHLGATRLGLAAAVQEPATAWTRRGRAAVLLLCWLPLPLRLAAAMPWGGGWAAISGEFIVLYVSIALSAVLTLAGVVLLLRLARARQFDPVLAVCTLIAAAVGLHALLA